jgi:hypothetical protein
MRAHPRGFPGFNRALDLLSLAGSTSETAESHRALSRPKRDPVTEPVVPDQPRVADAFVRRRRPGHRLLSTVELPRCGSPDGPEECARCRRHERAARPRLPGGRLACIYGCPLAAPPVPGWPFAEVQSTERGHGRRAAEHQAHRLAIGRPQHHAFHGKGQPLRWQRIFPQCPVRTPKPVASTVSAALDAAVRCWRCYRRPGRVGRPRRLEPADRARHHRERGEPHGTRYYLRHA